MTRTARPWLAPLTPLYRLAILARELGLRAGVESARRLRWPVVSIGSLSAGGAGKTPLTLALARALAQRGLCVNVLSRGYGRRRSSPARVDPKGTAEEFGDEPLLLARATGLPVFVAAQRYDAGLLAESFAQEHGSAGDDFLGIPEGRALPQGVILSRAASDPRWTRPASFTGQPPGIHLLDDGFQHRRLHRDIDIVLVSARDLNDKLLPAGNLRERIEALRRATILAIPAEEAETQSALTLELGWQGPVWSLRRQMEIPAIDGPAIAFCGIARPDQFFDGLKNAGLHLAAQVAFPDHHRYRQTDLDRLFETANRVGATAFLTTEKDRVRLGPLAARLESAAPLETVKLQIEIQDQDAALDSLTRLLFKPEN